MVGCSGSHVVDVVVGDKRIVEVDDDNSYRIDYVICESSLVNNCDDFGGLLLSFYPELERVLLSAMNYLKNDATRVTAECMMKLSTGCKWFMHGRVLMNFGIFFIMKLDNVHTCGLSLVDLVAKWCFLSGCMVKIDKARGGLFGDFATSFDQFRWYLETAMRTNPGSVFELDVDESSGCFRRLFMAFHGCLYGFQFCCSLLFVDGTFLKGRYKGHLLAATSKDGNQGLFLLAFAIVDAENQDNWMWFLSQLLKAVGSGQRLTFVSDRQHGLLNALSVVFPNAHHAFCLNHLKRNLIDKLVGLCTKYKLSLMKILVKCAYTPTVASFQHYMEKLRCIAGNGRVDSMLDGLQNDKWAHVFFRGKRYGEMSSNAAESYNNWIGGAVSWLLLVWLI
ncbi:uncharacterized protein LOC114280148 [Camellia sinensis]|uniref:uncharacterized protein LOC114280148 n=1 Tax=Camellia sinensis TaxID=4442 RepID=UPI00103679A6|nr:uncharacterized protein LOC114280148 [Camellia sinensis]